MTVVLHQDDDVARLRELVRDERKALQRDRYRVVLLLTVVKFVRAQVV